MSRWPLPPPLRHRRWLQAPSEDDIVRLADPILSGAFVGDFAVALERAAALRWVALALRGGAAHGDPAEANGAFSSDADEKAMRTKAARLMHTAGSLLATAKDFQHRCQPLASRTVGVTP